MFIHDGVKDVEIFMIIKKRWIRNNEDELYLLFLIKYKEDSLYLSILGLSYY